ncbi:hypothetical protein B0H16DRAFT_1589752 [Mycena metata]|uniref:PARP-type domain-containing protein n=1 Tax=Mycena metata TaxID=1033252 RepID=A0AAD7DFZ1_9AGAR|nr:hypothetical protein B0H16DRAFT_1655575 [Mycena metata]KAJ7727929.1 hypothetical protein B0H16DRAFT_1589752 [Mycena metata]
MSDNEGGKKGGYRLEYAKSSRAKCKGGKPCKGTTLEKGELRFGSLVEMMGKTSFAWRHWGCTTAKVLANVKKVHDAADEVDGFEELSAEDQARVSKAWEEGHVADEDIPESARKPAGDDDDEDETPKKKKSAPRKKKADAEDGDEPKPKKKAAPRKKKAADDDEDAGDEETEKKAKKPAPKKRAPKKKKDESDEGEDFTKEMDDVKGESDDEGANSEEEKPKKKAAKKAPAKAKAAPKKKAKKVSIILLSLCLFL